MKHEVKVRYPTSAAKLIELFCSEPFYGRKLQALAVPQYRVVDSQGDKKDFHIKLELKVAMQAPGVLKKVIPAEVTVIQEESWNRASRTGKVRVSSAVNPAEMSCTATITEAGKECVVSYLWEVKSKIPLIGGTLEKFICGDIDERAQREQQAAATLVK